jgi:glycosyltransferase involved in cell wall biosynthesis
MQRLSITLYLADQNPRRDRSLGITEYSERLVSKLLEYPEIEIKSLISRSSINVEGVRAEIMLPFRTDLILGRLLCDHFHGYLLPKADIYHYPKGFLPLLGVRHPNFVTIHDTILQFYADHYPTFRSHSDYAYWLFILKNTLREADVVLTVSEFSKRNIKEFCERHRIKAPLIIVTYEGAVGEEDAGTYGEKGNYFVLFASELPHKQTRRLLELWKELENSTRDAGRLVLIGQVAEDAKSLVGACKRVEYSGRLDRENLTALVRNSQGMLLPSEIEGFGLPALEAVYQGTPVAFVRGTAVDEILDYPGKGGFVLEDFDSFESALREIQALSPEEVARHALHLRSKYSWRAVAERTIAGYREALR